MTGTSEFPMPLRPINYCDADANASLSKIMNLMQAHNLYFHKFEFTMDKTGEYQVLIAFTPGVVMLDNEFSEKLIKDTYCNIFFDKDSKTSLHVAVREPMYDDYALESLAQKISRVFLSVGHFDRNLDGAILKQNG